VSPDEPRIGAHLPLGSGIVKAAERAGEIGATAIQVFADNPTAWRRRATPPRELPAFRETLARHGVAPLAIHAAYLVNLAGSDRAFASKSRAVLEAELRAAPGYGARFVNVHTGSHRDTTAGAGIRRVARAVARTLGAVEDGPDVPMVVLENSAGGGWSVGASVVELARIAEWASKLGVPDHRLGFCLDTAHAWGAGIRMDEPREIDRLLDEFERRIGLSRLVLVHFNDSRSAFGSRLDRHEHVGAGRIGERGMGHLIRHPRLRHAAFVMETPGMDEGYDLVNMNRARDLLAGRRLEQLPPAAFEIRGSRSRGVAPAAEEDEALGADGPPPEESAPRKLAAGAGRAGGEPSGGPVLASGPVS
jgi:deoxyribonuclease-4